MVNEASSAWGSFWDAVLGIGAIVSAVVTAIGGIITMARYRQRLDDYMETNDARVEALEDHQEAMHEENKAKLDKIENKTDQLLNRYVDRAFQRRPPP